MQPSSTTRTIEQFEDSQPYFNFINSLKSEYTKKSYKTNLLLFLKHHQLTLTTSLLEMSPEDLRDKIIKYFLQNKNHSKNTQRARLATLKHFCDMNDIILNWKKIAKFVNSDVVKSPDRGYTDEEIKRLIDYSDHRIKACFLMLASTGVRAGMLRDFKIKHLEDKGGGQLYKVKVYPGEAEEYITFTTPEARNAVDRYLDFRKRNGELITPESYLFVQQYNRFRRIRPLPYKKETLEHLLQHWLINAGIRKMDPLESKFKRKEVPRLHGFRKFFTTQLVHAKVIPEIRGMLLGHKIGLASAYYKPTEDEMLAEYEKAIDALTIDPSQRLQRKVEKLEVERTEIQALALELEKIKKATGVK